jgi:hypothetical protein
MSLPIQFDETSRLEDPSLHMAYRFEGAFLSSKENSMIGTIPSLQLSLDNRSALPALSISSKGVTHLFTLQSLHLSHWYPYKTRPSDQIALVIEGTHQKNPSEKLLLYIPVSKSATTKVPFELIETTITAAPMSGTMIDLNPFIPKKRFSYYTYENVTKYHVAFFEESDLKYSSLTIPDFNGGTMPATPKIETLTLSKDTPVYRKALSDTFQDNIYIDCVPVELLEKPKNYNSLESSSVLGSAGYKGNKFLELLVVLAYTTILIVVVFGLYKLGMYVNSKSKTTPDTPPPSNPRV